MRPSPEIAGSGAGAFGTPPEGVWASSAFGCSAWAGAAHRAAAAAAAGSAPRVRRVLIAGNATGARSWRDIELPSSESAARLAPAHVGHVERAGGARVRGVVAVRAPRDLGRDALRAAREPLVDVRV